MLDFPRVLVGAVLTLIAIVLHRAALAVFCVSCWCKNGQAEYEDEWRIVTKKQQREE